MKQVLQNVRSDAPDVVDVPEPAPKGGGVLVRNRASLISAGTERMVIDFAGKSMLGKARERPDLVKQVMDKVKREGLAATARTVMSRLDQPIALGYSCAGIVESVGRGAEEFAPGDRVACAGMGYASHAEVVYVPKNLTVRIPDGVSFEDASYVTLGAIALQGVRVADVRLGETVAVIGLGLLGQLSVQLLRAAGCRVLGIDLDPAKVALAIEMGAEAAIVRTEDVRGAVDAFTGGIGVDAVVIAAATDSNDPTELAGDICRERGRVSMVGAVKMDVPRKVYYEKELELRLSRSYGPGRYDPEYEERGHDYPVSYVRWTERRNMQEFLRLMAAGVVTPARLTTHRFPIAQADAAYEVITGGGEPFSGVILSYPEDVPAPQRTVTLKPGAAASGKVGVAFVGAGNFARAVLLPAFQRASAAELVGIATATGMNARTAGDKFGFRYCSTDVRQVLDDASVRAVVIATRHNSHGKFAADALRAGKAVFVEKPLAITEEGLAEVLKAQAESGMPLAVGFNRRFSSLSSELRAAFSGGPVSITYRINAGAIPASNWIQHPEEGGGRVIGEVCHFVDTASFLAGSDVTEVFAYAVGGPDGALNDTLTVSVRFGNGSIASIGYFATGDKAFPKERIEVYGGGAVGVLDDWRTLAIHRDGKVKNTRKLAQDKGFDQEVAAFLAAASGGALPISVESLAATTRATFAIEESLRTGRPVAVAAR